MPTPNATGTNADINEAVNLSNTLSLKKQEHPPGATKEAARKQALVIRVGVSCHADFIWVSAQEEKLLKLQSGRLQEVKKTGGKL